MSEMNRKSIELVEAAGSAGTGLHADLELEAGDAGMVKDDGIAHIPFAWLLAWNGKGHCRPDTKFEVVSARRLDEGRIEIVAHGNDGLIYRVEVVGSWMSTTELRAECQGIGSKESQNS